MKQHRVTVVDSDGQVVTTELPTERDNPGQPWEAEDYIRVAVQAARRSKGGKLSPPLTVTYGTQGDDRR